MVWRRRGSGPPHETPLEKDLKTSSWTSEVKHAKLAEMQILKEKIHEAANVTPEEYKDMQNQISKQKLRVPSIPEKMHFFEKMPISWGDVPYNLKFAINPMSMP